MNSRSKVLEKGAASDRLIKPEVLAKQTTRSSRKKLEKSLADLDTLKFELLRIKGAQKKILRFLAEQTNGSKTGLIQKKTMALDLSISEANLKKSTERLVNKGLVKTKGFKRVGGSVYWVHETILDNLESLLKDNFI